MPKIKTTEKLSGEELARRYTSDEKTRKDLFSRRGNREPAKRLLLDFIAAGDLWWVQDMLDRGVALENNKLNDMAPLFVAAAYGRTQIAQLLLDRKAPLDLRSSGGRTPLVAALLNRKPHMVRLLLERGAKTDITDYEGRTGLHWACEKHDPEIVRLLLEHGADPNIADKSLKTALIISAEQGQKDLAHLLLTHGVDLNDKVAQGARVMLMAIGEPDEEMVRTLLFHGVDPNRQWDGATPLTCALGLDMRPQNFSRSPCHVRLSMLRILLEHGADPCAIQKSIGWSALNAAAYRCQTEAMDLLLQTGIDVDEITAPGWTPLYSACLAGRLDMAQFLLEKGANPETPSNQDATCLEEAFSSGNIDLIRILIEKGALIDVRDETGNTLLTSAIFKKNAFLVRLLIEFGADVNAVCFENSNMLKLASRFGNEEIVALLKAHGAQFPPDPNEPAEWARHVQEDIVTAARDGKLSIAIELLQHLEDREVRTANAGMVLKAAAARNDLGSVRNLVKGYPELNLEGALVEASYQGSTQLQEFLMKRRLKPDGIHTAIPCAEALRTAVLQGKGAAVKCLMKHSQDLREDKELGPSLLEIAAQHGHSALLTMFLEKGFARDSGRLNRSGMSALREAVIKEDRKLIKRLLKEGRMSEEYVFHNQQPILITVVEKNDLRMAKKLLDAGAEIDIGGRGGTTPLITAAANGFSEMVELLLMRGADVNLRDEKGRTALDRAVARRRQPIVDLLRKSGARG